MDALLAEDDEPHEGGGRTDCPNSEEGVCTDREEVAWYSNGQVYY